MALAAAVAAAALAVAGVAGVRWLIRRLGAPPPQHSAAPRAGDEAVSAWRRAGKLPPPGAGEKPSPAAAAERVAFGQAVLSADRPGAAEEAIRAFRAALALAPDGADETAGYAIALSGAEGEGPDGEELARAHALLREALARQPAHPKLLAGYARLLLSVPSARNLAEAREVAARALRAAPSDPDALLAAGLASARSDPAAGARELAAAAARSPGDRRLLGAAARAAWEAGDAAGALSLSRSRLELDPDHPSALRLSAEVLAATDRPGEAGAALARWAQAHPDAAEPLLLEAMARYQVDRDLIAARRLLGAALARRPDDFLAARIHAHRAALEREAGNLAAARSAVADGLRLVPGSAPVQFQAALLAFEARDLAAFRESAGTVGDRAGPLAAARLAARALELDRDADRAQTAYLALADRISARSGGAPRAGGRAGPAARPGAGAGGRTAGAAPRSRRRPAEPDPDRLLGRAGAAGGDSPGLPGAGAGGAARGRDRPSPRPPPASSSSATLARPRRRRGPPRPPSRSRRHRGGSRRRWRSTWGSRRGRSRWRGPRWTRPTPTRLRRPRWAGRSRPGTGRTTRFAPTGRRWPGRRT